MPSLKLGIHTVGGDPDHGWSLDYLENAQAWDRLSRSDEYYRGFATQTITPSCFYYSPTSIGTG